MNRTRLFAIAIVLVSVITLLRASVNGQQRALVDWQKLMLQDGRTEDYYGGSVAISGKYAVVGAPGRDSFIPFWQSIGAAYVYENVEGVWQHRQYLLGSGLDGGDSFGNNVAIDGETIVIGAQNDNHVGAPQGSAFVVVRGSDSWYEQAKLLRTPGPGQNDWFGGSVAISGDTVVVGSQMDNNGIGSVYVFTRSGGTWTQQARLSPSDGQADDRFGRTVAIDGDTIIVSSMFDDETFDRQGSAYIFTRTGSTWTESAKLVADDPGTFDEFGDSVSIDGDTAVAGSQLHDVDGVGNRGTAYIFVKAGASWTLRQKLVVPGAQWTRFGASVSIEGGNLLVGALGSGSSGSVYLFRRRSGTWGQEGQFHPLDASSSALFGESVAISGGSLMAGARGDDIGTIPDQGSASAFAVPATTVLVTGRVLGPSGRGVNGTVVAMTIDGRETRYAVTNPFGYYRFSEVPTGNEATFSVPSKRASYTPRTMTVYSELTNVDFTPQP